jgi:hypothetical protein
MLVADNSRIDQRAWDKAPNVLIYVNGSRSDVEVIVLSDSSSSPEPAGRSRVTPRRRPRSPDELEGPKKANKNECKPS